MPEQRTALYRLRDGAGDLLYIGITSNPVARFAQHAADKDWWPEVADRDVVWFETRLLAEAAERAAILSENPRHNRLRTDRDVLARAGLQLRFTLSHELTELLDDQRGVATRTAYSVWLLERCLRQAAGAVTVQ